MSVSVRRFTNYRKRLSSRLLTVEVPEVSFVRETSIHGIREAWLIKNKPIKFLWTIILISCVCGVTYEIYRIVVYYKSNPSATQVKWVANDSYEYPPMVFCPRTFLNKEKIKKLNMSKAALAYTVSLFQTVHETTLPKGFDLNEAKDEVKRIMRKNYLNTYLDLFVAIAFDGKDVLYGISLKSIKLEVYVPRTWLCYKLQLPRVEASTLKTGSTLQFLHFPTRNVTEYDLKNDAAILIHDTTGTKTNMILFSKKAQYDIDIQVQVHKRLSRPGLPCLRSDEVPNGYYVDDCQWACLHKERYSSGCSQCLPFQLLTKFNNNIEPCYDINADFVTAKRMDDELKERNQMAFDTLKQMLPKMSFISSNDSKSCEENEIISRSKPCLLSCLPVCEQWMYAHSTLIFDDYNSSVYIRLIYNPSNGILTYEEVPTYNFDTFVSNIGGQLGLWLGASVVSLFQIFYYTCLAMCRKTKRTNNKI